MRSLVHLQFQHRPTTWGLAERMSKAVPSESTSARPTAMVAVPRKLLTRLALGLIVFHSEHEQIHIQHDHEHPNLSRPSLSTMHRAE